MNIKKNIVTFLASLLVLSGALFASTQEEASPSESWDSSADSVSTEAEAVDYVELIRTSLAEDEECAAYADTLTITVEGDLVTLAGSVDSEDVRDRIEEIVSNTTHFEIDNQIEVSAADETDSESEDLY